MTAMAREGVRAMAMAMAREGANLCVLKKRRPIDEEEGEGKKGSEGSQSRRSRSRRSRSRRRRRRRKGTNREINK